MHEPQRNRRNRTGPITIGVIFALGLVMLASFWRATRSSDPAPADAKFVVPKRTIRVLSLNLAGLDLDRAISSINASKVDIVLLQRVRTTDVARIGKAINMSRTNQPSGEVFYPAQNFEGPSTPYGNAIFSRFPLHEGRSIPNRGGSFGVWAVAVIDGAKVMVASVELTDLSSQVLGAQDAANVRAKEQAMLARAHRELGDPPMIVGGNKDAPIQADAWTVRPIESEVGVRYELVPR